MRWCIVIWTVVVIQCLRLHHLSDSIVLLQRFFRDHQMFLLHVMLILLMEAVQAMDELVLARMHWSTRRSQQGLVSVLLAAHELLLVGEIEILLAAYRVVISVYLDILETLTAQWKLVRHALRTLQREVRRRR